MDSILEFIDDIKRNIPDQNYIDIMNALKCIYEGQSKDQSRNIAFGCMNVLVEDSNDDDDLLLQTWYKEGYLHREGDLPAEIGYNENGQISSQEWYINGNRHRDAECLFYTKLDCLSVHLCSTLSLLTDPHGYSF